MTMSPPQAAIDAAVAEAGRSPCQKSKRGCAAFATMMDDSTRILGLGHNGPAGDRMQCDGSCRIMCSHLCVHAEDRAIRDLMRVSAGRGLGMLIDSSAIELVHVKVVDDHFVSGGPPSCWSCANLVIESQIAAVWLYEDLWGRPMWTRWWPPLFYEATMKRQRLHPSYEPRRGIETPCEDCGALAGAKRDGKGFWRCTHCGYPSP